MEYSHFYTIKSYAKIGMNFTEKTGSRGNRTSTGNRTLDLVDWTQPKLQKIPPKTPKIKKKDSHTLLNRSHVVPHHST